MGQILAIVAVVWFFLYIGYRLEQVRRRYRGDRPLLYSLQRERKKCDSPIEEILFDALVKEGLYPRTQVKVYPFKNAQRPYKLDLAVYYRFRKIDVECDGEQFHTSKEQVEHDEKRDLHTSSKGWRVLRFTGHEINQSPKECVKEVLEHLGYNKAGTEKGEKKKDPKYIPDIWYWLCTIGPFIPFLAIFNTIYVDIPLFAIMLILQWKVNRKEKKPSKVLLEPVKQFLIIVIPALILSYLFKGFYSMLHGNRVHYELDAQGHIVRHLVTNSNSMIGSGLSAVFGSVVGYICGWVLWGLFLLREQRRALKPEPRIPLREHYENVKRIICTPIKKENEEQEQQVIVTTNAQGEEIAVKKHRWSSVRVGIDVETGEEVFWNGSDRFVHLAATGPTGGGKTALAMRPMIYQDMEFVARENEGCIIAMEPNSSEDSGFVWSLNQRAKKMGLKSLYLDITQNHHGIYWNFFKGDDINAVATRATTVLMGMLKPGKEEYFFIKSQMAFNYITRLLKLLHGDDVDLMLLANTLGNMALLKDKLSRLERMINKKDSLQAPDHWTGKEFKEAKKVYDTMNSEIADDPERFAKVSDNIRTQILNLLADSRMTDLFTNRSGTPLSLESDIEQPGMILINTGNELTGLTFGKMILMYLQICFVSRPGMENNRPGVYFYCDEFGSYATNGFQAAFTQARKFCVSIFPVFQNLGQLRLSDNEDYIDVVLANSRNFIVLPGIYYKDAKEIEEMIDDIEIIDRKKTRSTHLIIGDTAMQQNVAEQLKEEKRFTAGDIRYMDKNHLMYFPIVDRQLLPPKELAVKFADETIPEDILQLAEQRQTESQQMEEAHEGEGIVDAPVEENDVEQEEQLTHNQSEKRVVFSTSNTALQKAEDTSKQDPQPTTKRLIFKKVVPDIDRVDQEGIIERPVHVDVTRLDIDFNVEDSQPDLDTAGSLVESDDKNIYPSSHEKVAEEGLLIEPEVFSVSLRLGMSVMDNEPSVSLESTVTEILEQNLPEETEEKVVESPISDDKIDVATEPSPQMVEQPIRAAMVPNTETPHEIDTNPVPVVNAVNHVAMKDTSVTKESLTPKQSLDVKTIISQAKKQSSQNELTEEQTQTVSSLLKAHKLGQGSQKAGNKASLKEQLPQSKRSASPEQARKNLERVKPKINKK